MTRLPVLPLRRAIVGVLLAVPVLLVLWSASRWDPAPAAAATTLTPLVEHEASSAYERPTTYERPTADARSPAPDSAHVSAPVDDATAEGVSVARRAAYDARAGRLPPPPAGRERLPFLYLSATSSSHFRFLPNLIHSIHLVDPGAPHLVVDLGLRPAERAWLAATEGVYLHTFNYSNYPDYFDVRVRAGEYAFKAVVVEQALEHYADVVLWLDTRDIVHAAMSKRAAEIADVGFATGVSQGDIKMWTHPGMLQYYGIGPRDPILNQPNCNAAFLMFGREKTLNDLVRPWVACALKRECIAPPGSSRANHRQDQAALTILVHKSGGRYKCGANWNLIGAIAFHQDFPHTPDRRKHEGVGRPTSLERLAWHNLWWATELASSHERLLRLWLRTEHALSIAAIPPPGPDAVVPTTALDVLAHLYVLAAPAGGKHAAVALADLNLADPAAQLASLLQAHVLKSLLGAETALFTVAPTTLANLRHAAGARYGDTAVLLGEPGHHLEAEVDDATRRVLPSQLRHDSTPEVVVPPAALRLMDGPPGPLLVHLSPADATDSASTDVARWRGTVLTQLWTYSKPAALVVYLEPGDSHAAPWDHLQQLAGAGWGRNADAVLAWVTPGGSAAAAASADGATGCAAVWGADGLTRFRAAAQAADMRPAAFALGRPHDTAGPGCLLAAIPKTMEAPAYFTWS